MGEPRTRTARAALAVLLAIAWPMASPSAPAAAAVGDRLPDLAMARPLDLRGQTLSNGRRLLRFTTMIVNIGDGPFETRAARSSVRASAMVVKQRIYDLAGGYRVVSTSAMATFSGDGHDHWHVQRVAHYELFAATGVTTAAIARSSKVGFCFFDMRPYRLSLPGASRTRRYSPTGCGTRGTLAVRNGISVGWADRYGAELRFQAIDVTDLPPGEYLLRVSADPNGYFVERSDTNNCNWTRIQVRRSSPVVPATGWGAGCTLPGASPTPTPTPSSTPTPTPTATPTPPPTPSIPPPI